MKVTLDKPWREKYYRLLDKVFDAGFMSEGFAVKEFEERFGASVGLGAAAFCNWGLAALAVLEYYGVRGKEVVVPTNTFMADIRAVQKAGGTPVFCDCTREDLCLSLDDLGKRVTPKTRAVILTHIGGHLSFKVREIAEFCRSKGLALIEDCAHCHGASWDGRAGGSFGDAGIYSFYATKTMPLGEGGMVVSADKSLMEYVGKYRNYGKFEYVVPGINGRMNEVTAALGLVQLERLPEILAFKRDLAARYDAFFRNRVRFPKGMVSGYYKYIVFDEPGLKEETGKVFGELCHELSKVPGDFPNAAWVKEHHRCPPMFEGWDGAGLSPERLKARLLA